MNIAKSEQVETDLARLIDRRDTERRKTEGDRPAEEMYVASTRRYHERHQRQQWWEHLRYHEAMMVAHTRNLEALIERHRKEAERYAQLLGVEPIDESALANGHKKGKAP